MQLRSLLLSTLILLASSTLATAQSASGKSLIPNAAALKTAAKLVEDVYKDDLANAKSPAEKLALAQKLLDASSAEKDPAARFTLLTEALNLACEAADLQSAAVVVDTLDRAFNIDALKLKSDSAAFVAKISSTSDQQRRFISLAAPLIDSALDADRYDLAKSLATSIVDAAGATEDVRLISESTTRLQQVADAQQAFDDANKALAILAEKPTDPDANLKVGSFRCLLKNDWATGLPMLALSPDDPMKSLAKTELAAPATPEDQAKLADGWWDLSEKSTGAAKSNLQSHAAKWYQASLQNLTGLAKMRVEKRLAALAETEHAIGETKSIVAQHGGVNVDSGLQIVKAEWGAGNRQEDVLNKVRDMMKGDTLQLTADASTFGDPAFGQTKELLLTFDSKGVQTTLRLTSDSQISISSTPPSATPADGLQIIEAKWGAGTRRADVRKTLQDLVKDGTLQFTTNPPVFPDNAFGQHKELSLSYRIRGMQATLLLKDNSQFFITYKSSTGPVVSASTMPPSAPGLRPPPITLRHYTTPSTLQPPTGSQPPTPITTSDLQILDAKWGAGKRQIDVTAKLRDHIKDAALRCTLTNSLLGDPAPGEPKTLVLTYQAHGEKITLQLKEGDELRITGAPIPPPAPVNPNAIERPEFASLPKPIQKNITSITSMMVRVADDGDPLGLTTDIIATVPPETRHSRDSGAGFNRSRVGEDMKTSFDEAVRAVHLRYPTWEGRIDFSFGEKYTEHDGGSAGTAFGLLLLSSLEGFDLDPKCAVTGDITVDWKVRKVSAVASKLHGAILDKALYAAIPATNEDVMSDLPLLFGDNSLWDIQTLSIATLQEAVAVVRADRTPQLTEALKLFTDLQPTFAKSGKAALHNPATIATLKRILELAPNHLSARALLALADNTAPKFLSNAASLYRFSIIAYPYRNFLNGRAGITRETLPPSTTANARKEIEQLRRIASKDIQPLVTDMAALIEVAEESAARKSRTTDFDKSRDALLAHLASVSANRELLEKIVREGY